MTALDTRLLEWLEAWAKARGWWESEQAPGTKTPWTVGHGRGGRIAVWHGRERWDLDLLVAWLWAHAVDTGREVRRRCPDCVTRGGPMEWALDDAYLLHEDSEEVLQTPREWEPDGELASWDSATVVYSGRFGLKAKRGGGVIGDIQCEVYSRHCPTKGPTECVMCHGRGVRLEPAPRDPVAEATRERLWVPDPPHTEVDCECTLPKPLGYLDTPLARVVCEGAPKELPERGLGKWLARTLDNPDFGQAPGDPTARTELLAAAYGLLVGWTDEERAFKCEGCRPRASSDDDLTRVCTSVGGCPSEPGVAIVLRDYLETLGKAPADLTPEIALALGCKPHGVLGQALALWLSGAPCEQCEDLGLGVHAVRKQVGRNTVILSCPACHGHGTALAAYVAQQLALVGEMRPTPAGDSPVDRMDATVAL